MKRLLFISMIALFGCDKNEVEKPIVYGGFHYAIPHNTGNEQEDPNTGCPCACIVYGWSSYSTMTNAFAHGIKSPFDELKKRRGCTNGVFRLVDVYEIEKEIEKELKEGAK